MTACFKPCWAVELSQDGDACQLYVVQSFLTKHFFLSCTQYRFDSAVKQNIVEQYQERLELNSSKFIYEVGWWAKRKLGGQSEAKTSINIVSDVYGGSIFKPQGRACVDRSESDRYIGSPRKSADA